MKIAVYGIMRDAELYVDKFMEGAQEADQIIIGVDVRTKDKTAEKLYSYGVDILDIDVNPWRFDTARNIVLDAIPQDVDICVSLDMDDFILPGWRKELEKVWVDDVDRVRYPYTTDFNADDQPMCSMRGYKIHKRQGVHWIFPVHESLMFDGEVIRECYTDKIQIWHLKHGPDTDYTDMLLDEIKSNPSEADQNWMRYVLVRESMKFRRYDQAVKYAKDFLEHTHAYGVCGYQRSECIRIIAKCILATRPMAIEESIMWSLRACSEYPIQRENWGCLADFWLVSGEYDWALPAYQQMLKCTDKLHSEVQELQYWNDEYARTQIKFCKRKREGGDTCE